jgi:transposase-like protein
MSYSPAFRENMVRKMTGPNGVSAHALSRDVGVSQSALSRWLREARMVGVMSKNKEDPKTPKSPRDWTFEEKLRAVAEAAGLADEELGAFLRREGIHEAQLKQWRDAMAAAVADTKRKASKREKATAKQVKKLERELRRKEKALAEVTALLVLKKKAEAIWGAEDDATRKKSDE